MSIPQTFGVKFHHSLFDSLTTEGSSILSPFKAKIAELPPVENRQTGSLPLRPNEKESGRIRLKQHEQALDGPVSPWIGHEIILVDGLRVFIPVVEVGESVHLRFLVPVRRGNTSSIGTS